MGEENVRPFDLVLYGAIVRSERGKAGCKTTADFSAMIYRRTRLEVSKDALYRIEQGRQQPTLEQFMAINLALFGELYPRLGSSVLDSCPSRKWVEYDRNEEIPSEWKAENLRAAFSEHGFMSVEGRPCVLDCDLPGDEYDYMSVSDYLPEGDRFSVTDADGEVHEVWAVSEGFCVCF